MVKFLDYKGTEIPVRVSYYALKKMKQVLGRSVSLVDNTDYEAYEELLFHSITKGCLEEGVPMPFVREDMEDVMDAVYFDFIAIIPLFFQTKEQMKKAKEEAEKLAKEGGDEKKP
jgi:hypothetical protein